MFVFVHAQGIKTVNTRGGGGKKWQNSVQVVVEWPLISIVECGLILRVFNSVPSPMKLSTYIPCT